MRTLFIFCFLLAFGHSFSQQDGRKYTFKEVGWSFVLPADFTPLDSAENEIRNNTGKKAIEEANNVAADFSQTKTLIAANKSFNHFNATLTPFNPQIDGNYEEATKAVNEMVYNTFSVKMPGAKIDTATTTVLIDGLNFYQFKVTVTMDDKVLLNMFLLSRLHKGYDFGISYLYMDEKTKEQIESILSSSKFQK